jgi:hypothetical protein
VWSDRRIVTHPLIACVALTLLAYGVPPLADDLARRDGARAGAMEFADARDITRGTSPKCLLGAALRKPVMNLMNGTTKRLKADPE